MSAIRLLTIEGTPATKRTIVDATTGWTLYAIVTQEATGYLLADADGVFAAAPADPYQELAEDAVVKGRYACSEARTAWDNGYYSVAVYRQLGASPAPSTDTLLGIGGLRLSGDAEADSGSVLLVEYALCSLAQVKRELGFTTTDEDDRVSRAINDGTDRIETICNRLLLKRAANTTEYHDAPWPGERDRSSIWTREYPFAAADIVSVEYGSYLSRAAVASANILVERNRVIVLPATALPVGPQATKVVYNPGYTTAPHDIQGVAINLAQRLYWISKRIAAADEAETVGGQSRKQIALAFSAEDQLIIDKYKRVESGRFPTGQEWLR